MKIVNREMNGDFFSLVWTLSVPGVGGRDGGGTFIVYE